MRALTDSELIDEAGGTGVVAKFCSVLPSAVSNWREDGIPGARRHQIARLLADIDKSNLIPPDYYDRSVPAPRQAKAAGSVA